MPSITVLRGGTRFQSLNVHVKNVSMFLTENNFTVMSICNGVTLTWKAIWRTMASQPTDSLMEVTCFGCSMEYGRRASISEFQIWYNHWVIPP